MHGDEITTPRSRLTAERHPVTVAPDELTGTEQAVLLVLMAECRPVPNPELNTLGPVLELARRPSNT
jgi:hypothetical protein